MREGRLFLFGTLLFLTACHREPVQQKTITLAPQTLTKTLYFSGTVRPLSQEPLTAPLGGVIKKVFFEYGYPLSKGQLLCTIYPSDQRSQYENALTNYLKNKQQLMLIKTQFQNAGALYAQGLIARNEYDQVRKDQELAELTFLLGKRQLEVFLPAYPINDLERLSLADMKKVQGALNVQTTAEALPVMAPRRGVALFSKDIKLVPGTKLGTGDVLLYIADLSGISIVISVDEASVSQLSPGQPVAITFPAVPEISVTGKIDHIHLQANADSDPPAFEVNIVVPHLTKTEQQGIHPGMTAKVSMVLQQKDQLIVPLTAVTQKDQTAVVRTIDAKTHAQKEVTVTTGDTTADSVVVSSGVKSGTQVVVTS